MNTLNRRQFMKLIAGVALQLAPSQRFIARTRRLVSKSALGFMTSQWRVTSGFST